MDGWRQPQEPPSIPRDTRLLLVIVLTAVVMLWVLARVRFPDQPPTPNPVPPVLAQLAPPSPLDEMVSIAAGLQRRLDHAIVPVGLHRDATGPDAAPPITVAALRFRSDLALFMSGRRPALQAASQQAMTEARWDPASNLAVVPVPAEPSEELSTWTPRRLGSPRFLMAVGAFGDSMTTRPVFVSALIERTSAIWSGTVWIVPENIDLQDGTFLFTREGGWVGVTADTPAGRAIIPAEMVLARADQLEREGPRQQGRLGIEVQSLTAGLAAATGAAGGVIVAWVDANGPAAGRLEPGDTIEAIDGEHLSSVEEWIARTARLQPNASIVLRVRWQDEVRDVTVTAQGERPEPANRPLGLTLRTFPKMGAAVVRVDSGSAAEAAGLQPGDVLTLVADHSTPKAVQALRAFTDAPRDRPILVGVTRGERHFMITISRTW